jgi:DNA-directed RNA polymerase specialized sigma24 family protein
MVGDALVKMYAALKYKKYKLTQDSSPFAYFTTIAFNAFINRIKKEQRHHKTHKDYKEKMYEDIMTDPNMCQGQLYVKPNRELNLDGTDD